MNERLSPGDDGNRQERNWWPKAREKAEIAALYLVLGIAAAAIAGGSFYVYVDSWKGHGNNKSPHPDNNNPRAPRELSDGLPSQRGLEKMAVIESKTLEGILDYMEAAGAKAGNEKILAAAKELKGLRANGILYVDVEDFAGYPQQEQEEFSTTIPDVNLVGGKGYQISVPTDFLSNPDYSLADKGILFYRALAVHREVRGLTGGARSLYSNVYKEEKDEIIAQAWRQTFQDTREVFGPGIKNQMVSFVFSQEARRQD